MRLGWPRRGRSLASGADVGDPNRQGEGKRERRGTLSGPEWGPFPVERSEVRMARPSNTLEMKGVPPVVVN